MEFKKQSSWKLKKMYNFELLANYFGCQMIYVPSFEYGIQNYQTENSFQFPSFICPNFEEFKPTKEPEHPSSHLTGPSNQATRKEEIVDRVDSANKGLEEKEKDRNMISNSLKVFRKYIKDSSHFDNSPIGSVIRQRSLDYTTSQFLEDLDEAIPKDRNYLGAKFLTDLALRRKQDTNFQIVLRILLRYYYKKMVFPAVSTSLKILKDAKKRQFVGARKIMQMLGE